MKRLFIILVMVVLMFGINTNAQSNECAEGWLCGSTMSSVVFFNGGYPFIQIANCCTYSSEDNACFLEGDTSSACKGERLSNGFYIKIPL